MPTRKFRFASEVWLVLFLVLLVCAAIVVSASSSDESLGEKPSAAGNTYDCLDPTLSKATVTTRLETTAASDRPMFFAETSMQLDTQWTGVEGLKDSPKSSNFGAALGCIMPLDSTAYRMMAPGVSISEGRATIRDAVGYRAEDLAIPKDLGVWRFSYGDVKASACSDSEPERKVAGSILAVVCPNEGSIRDATWMVNVDLGGFTLISSSRTPIKYDSATGASWQLSGQNKEPLWLELQPSWSANLYVTTAEWANGSVQTVFWGSGWFVFFGLMWLIAHQRAKATPQLVNSHRSGIVRRPKAPRLEHICLAGVFVTVTIVVVDVIYQLSGFPGPSAPSERLWAVGALTFGVVLYSLTLNRRRGTVLVSCTILIFLAIYFGPRQITLETTYEETFGHPIGTLQRLGYLNHVALGIALVTVVTMFLLKMLSDLINAIGASGIVSKTLQRGPMRCAIGLIVGILVIGQWVHVRAQLDDRRALIPGRQRTLATVRDQLLDDLPWIPDFLGHWLPQCIYYAILLAGFSWLAQRANSNIQDELAALPDSRQRGVITLIFAAAVVGTAGQYRGLVFPLAFLITLALLWILGRRSLGPGSTAFFTDVDLGDSRALERVQCKLLERSKRAATQQRRNEAMERKYEKGEVTPAAWAQESVLRLLVERRDAIGYGARGHTTRVVGREFTEQEQALALGPYADWLRNAFHATRIGLFLAIPVIAYDAFAEAHSGTMEAWLSSQGGTLEAIQWVSAEILVWLAASFTLGAFWPLLPGRRGFHKGAVLGGIAGIASAADVMLLRALEVDIWDAASFVLLLFSYLAVVGVIIDIKTLKKIERQRWEFVDYLRLRDTRWLAAYGLTGLALVSVVITQVSEGKPLTSLPLTLIDAVTRGAG